MAKGTQKPSASTMRHRDFAAEYVLNGYNATQAYLTVYKPKNDKHANQNASDILANHEVQELLAELVEDSFEMNLPVMRAKLRDEHAAIAFSRISDYLDDEGGIDRGKVLNGDRGAIKRYTERLNPKTGEVYRSIELHDKHKSLDPLGKMVGLTPESEEGKGGLTVHVHLGEEARHW